MIPQLAAILEYLDGRTCPACYGYRAGGLKHIECVFCASTGKDPEAQRLLAAWRGRPALREALDTPTLLLRIDLRARHASHDPGGPEADADAILDLFDRLLGPVAGETPR